jgi:signal transduction histidine kinase
VDISELVQETLSLVESEIQKHEIILQKVLAENPSSTALIDRVQIQQVVLNLVVNAIEAMSGSTADYRLLQIFVSADDDRAVLITVKDTGAGIDANDLDKIFDSFFTTKPNGMGLGLSICRSIVETHGGRLWATANIPHGAIFNIWLPTNR